MHLTLTGAMITAGCTRPVRSDAARAGPFTTAGDAAAPPENRVLPPHPSAGAKPPLAKRLDGPHAVNLAPGRPIFYALPQTIDSGLTTAGAKPVRLIGHLHGMCGPPSYACGKWIGAAVDTGALVCPTGNARCGDSPNAPPSWEALNWNELVSTMDADLETSIAKVSARHPGSFRRDGAVLTGYSRGAYAAAAIARKHPDRWPYLVLIEASVQLDAASLHKAGVRAVALVAGEVGREIASMRKTANELGAAGLPARLFIMPRAGHLYSDNMDDIMREALAFVLSY